MSSSAPKRQPVREASPFDYAEAGAPGGVRQRVRRRPAVEERIRATAGRGLRAGTAERATAAPLRTRCCPRQASRADRPGALRNSPSSGKITTAASKAKWSNWRSPLPARFCIAKCKSIRNALAGIVRVTLEKLDTGTKVNLHVHPQRSDRLAALLRLPDGRRSRARGSRRSRHRSRGMPHRNFAGLDRSRPGIAAQGN